MNQTVPYGYLIIYSSSNGQFSANIKHKQSHLRNYFPSIYTSRWTRLFMGNTYEPKRNLKGMSSDKRDSAFSWNKMNLTLLCGNLTFYSSRLISNRSNMGKMELVPRKFWQTNCKQFKIILHYILNLHTYILPILHSLWSWTMRKSKSRAEEMIFTARKNVSTVEVKLKGIESQSFAYT